MLVRASLAAAHDLPPGQTATPFAALNAGLDPVSSECLCLKKGNPAINGQGSLGLPSHGGSASDDEQTVATQVPSAFRTSGLTTSSTASLELNRSARSPLGNETVGLALAENQYETVTPKWELQGEPNGRSQMGQAGSIGRGGLLNGDGSSNPETVNNALSASVGSAATLMAEPDEPTGTLAFGELKTGPTPDSGLVGVGTSPERTLVTVATGAYLPGATPVSREDTALSQRVSLRRLTLRPLLRLSWLRRGLRGGVVGVRARRTMARPVRLG